MKINQIKEYYRRNLPHIQPIGAIFFVTFRLFDSIPKSKLYNLKQKYEYKKSILIRNKTDQSIKELKKIKKRYFSEYDKLLDNIKIGNHYLKIPEIANIVLKELHRFDNDLYDLIAYCIMSNHVHILIDTSIQLPDEIDVFTFGQIDFEPLQTIMKRIKGASARYANNELGRRGAFWQKESYDHFVRSDIELRNIIAYILNNPLNAGIVDKWEDYLFSFCKYEL